MQVGQYMSLFISVFSFCRGRKGTKAELRAHLNGVVNEPKGRSEPTEYSLPLELFAALSGVCANI